MPRTSVGMRVRAAAVTVAMTAGLVSATAAFTAPSASAAYAPRGSWDYKVNEVMYQAAKQNGKPYRYGAAGPSAFDCSGLVKFVFNRALGRNLPRTAAQQYAASTHIRRTSLRVGDLVFVKSGSSITHVGIYAGRGYWWVAPHTGSHVQKQRIYTSNVVYGRVIR